MKAYWLFHMAAQLQNILINDCRVLSCIGEIHNVQRQATSRTHPAFSQWLPGRSDQCSKLQFIIHSSELELKLLFSFEKSLSSFKQTNKRVQVTQLYGRIATWNFSLNPRSRTAIIIVFPFPFFQAFVATGTNLCLAFPKADNLMSTSFVNFDQEPGKVCNFLTHKSNW